MVTSTTADQRKRQKRKRRGGGVPSLLTTVGVVVVVVTATIIMSTVLTGLLSRNPATTITTITATRSSSSSRGRVSVVAAFVTNSRSSSSINIRTVARTATHTLPNYFRPSLQQHGHGGYIPTHTTAATTATTATAATTLSLSTTSSRLFSTTASEDAAAAAAADATDLTDEQKAEIEAKIKAKGDEIRALKDGGADKATVAPLVEELLALKAQLDPSIAAKADKKNKNKQQQKQKQQQPQQKQKQQQQQQQSDDSDEESDFITARSVDYSKWYNDLIRVTGLAETSPVRGCMVIKPWGMAIWDKVRNELDQKIQDHGAENAYFPLLIPKSFLSKEAEHVDGFAKECAVVTHHRLTASKDPSEGLIADPDAELEDPLIIRPTSETMIWYMFRKWINSHRYVFFDLSLSLSLSIFFLLTWLVSSSLYYSITLIIIFFSKPSPSMISFSSLKSQ